MWRIRETTILVLVILLVGGGTALLQQGGVHSVGTIIVSGSMQHTVQELEEIARYAHDYLNGYLSGSGWGTVLPQDLMQEEIKRLKIHYEMAAEMATFLYPLDHRLEPLFYDFAQGFEQVLEGLQQNDMELLLDAHRIFHQIDLEIFHRDQTGGPVY